MKTWAEYWDAGEARLKGLERSLIEGHYGMGIAHWYLGKGEQLVVLRWGSDRFVYIRLPADGPRLLSRDDAINMLIERQKGEA